MTAILGASGSGLNAWQFHVSPLGGSADDTGRLQTAISNAVTYALNNQGYAELYLDPALYTLSSPTTKSATNKGNAQLWLPLVGTGVSGVTLVIRSSGRHTVSHGYFGQSVAQSGGGTILQSTLTGQANDGTWGAPSVLGGPTPQQGYGTNAGSPLFSNMQVVIDGITVMAPLNPTVVGVDLRGVARMSVPRLSCLVSATPSQMNVTQPSNSWTTGLLTPQNLNNDQSFIGQFDCYGYAYGLSAGEHLSAQRLTFVYCGIGLFPFADGWGNHGWNIGYMSAELVNDAVNTVGLAALSFPRALVIGEMDCESVGHYAAGFHVNDPNNTLGGTVNIMQNTSPPSLLVTGAANLRVIAGNLGPGHWASPPAVPASGTPQQNTAWRDAWIVIHTGVGVTVSAITVDGTSTGLTMAASSSLGVSVPSGKNVTLTYAGGTPTWDWWLS